MLYRLQRSSRRRQFFQQELMPLGYPNFHEGFLSYFNPNIYDSDKFIGKGTWYHENGKKQEEALYENGKILSSSCWNKKGVKVIEIIINNKTDINFNEEIEKKIIKKAIINLNQIDPNKAEEILKLAEKKEEESNQIVEFTREIKQYPMEFRLKIIEIIWKIVYSDGTSDNYESNLIRRICGLLYISDKDNGNIKIKVKNFQ